MSLDEELLQLAAKDASMDYEKWPAMLDPLLERLEHIIHNDFPIPRTPPHPINSFATPASSLPYTGQETNSQANSNKENAPPPSQLITPPRRPPVPPNSSAASIDRIPDSQPQHGPTDDALPPPIVSMFSSIQSTLRTYFSQKPPHTIQRLAELVLHSTAHYRTLPAYLRALDRVVSVSSGADIFPLPVSMPLPGGLIDMSLANGVNGAGGGDKDLGSDESLGGALLTPIPWLNNTALQGGVGSPNGDTLTVVPRESGGVTQGELIRQEQQAGVIPTSQQLAQRQQSHPSVVVENDGTEVQTEDGEELPHARGPALLGVEDMGLQDGRGVQMSLARSPTGVSATPDVGPGDTPGTEDVPGHDKPANEDATADAESDRDGDGDIVIGDSPNDQQVGEQLKDTSEAAEKPTSSPTSTESPSAQQGGEVTEAAQAGNDGAAPDNDKMDS